MCQREFVRLPCCTCVCQGSRVCISECGSCTSCDLESYDYMYMCDVFIHTAWDALTLNSCLQKASQNQLACLSSLQTKFHTHTWFLKQETQLAILHCAKPHTQQIFFSCLSSITLFFHW